MALPFKGAVAHMDYCNEGMKIVDVDLSILKVSYTFIILIDSTVLSLTRF